MKTQTSEEVLVSTHLVALEWYQSKSLQGMEMMINLPGIRRTLGKIVMKSLTKNFANFDPFLNLEIVKFRVKQSEFFVGTFLSDILHSVFSCMIWRN